MLALSEQKKGETAKQYVTRTLRSNIVDLHLKPGDKINENVLCDIYGISRTPIREAILELSQKKMIDIYAKQGTYVSYIHTQDVQDFLSLRVLLESELMDIACEVATPADIDALKENVAIWAHLMSTGNISRIQQQDKLFHHYIYNMCNRHFWHDVIESCVSQFDRTVHLMFHCLDLGLFLNDHIQIVDAIEARDSEKARSVIKDHLNRYQKHRAACENLYPNYFI